MSAGVERTRRTTVGTILATVASLGWVTFATMGVGVATAAALEPPTGTADPVCTASGDLRTCDFTFTRSDGSWVVPADIVSSNIAVEVRGGSGGKGLVGAGGLGAYVAGTVGVAPGDKIVMLLGGQGGDSRPVGSSAPPTDFGLGGFPNGGSAGGRLPTSDGSTPPYDSGGGGGSSIVGLMNAQGTVVPLAIAAGGGGGAGGTYFRFGGINGGNADADGADGAAYVDIQATGGKGGRTGSDSVGGAGGPTGYCKVPGQTVGRGGDGTTPSPGAPTGVGGSGGSAYNVTFSTGGGGGGGLTGGGGGGAGGSCEATAFDRSGTGGGGGGGRSIYDPTLLSNGNIAVSGVAGDGSARISYRVADAVDPDTTITSQPANPTTATAAQITFSGTDGSDATASGLAGFECALDGADFTPCTSPAGYTGLAQGVHTFHVRALDAVGHRDATPALYQWTIDTSASLGTCVPGGVTTVCTFTFNDTVPLQTWLVPTGVTRATIRVDGAGGGRSSDRTGGRGGRTEGTVAVVPGEVLRLSLGSRGGDLYGPPARGAGCPGGLNGGGAGGCFRSTEPGAGGGGGTDVRRSPYLLGDRLLVGGGGGGAGLDAGGDGGGLSGQAGAGDAGGGGGTQIAGGSSTGPFCTGIAGNLGMGGSDGECPHFDVPFGGGGGGGYYGGAGGYNGGGGGGGSSFATPSAGAVTLTAGGSPVADGQVRITYGQSLESQTLTFDPLADRTFGDPVFTVSATSSAGLPVSFTAFGDCAVTASTVSLTAAGSCTITASQAGDARHEAAADVSRSFAIAPAIQLGSPAAVQYSDALALTATVGGAAGTVAFAVNGYTFCSASVVDGTAGCQARVTLPAGVYGVRATFTPDHANQGTASAEASVTVSAEDAAVAFTGSPFVSTGSATQTSATVPLTARVSEIADAAPGDITNAKVVFDLYRSTNLTGSPDWSVPGTVAADGSVSASKTLPSDNYVVVVRLLAQAPNYYGGPASVATVVTVYTPTTGVWANGGGWVIDPGTSNLPVAISPGHPKGSFGFSVRYKSSTTPQGQSVYVFHGADGYDYVVKANSWTGGAAAFTKTATGGTTAFTAKAAVVVFNPATGTTVPGLGGGNFTFRVDAVDGGKTDTYAISVYTSKGKLFHQVGTTSAQRAVMGGNLTVHRT